ncbi:MAG: SRPBCC family protein, partial [Candidatus Dormibacteraeota bacterium]|nr:SRPBCC family protein [Candidatus Dormibacteraeota bacterium]
ADERNEPRYNPQMLRAEQISSGPIGLGTRFRAETASMGRTAEMTIEFTTFERPRQLASTIQMAAMDIQGTLTFDPVPEGTRMRWSWDVEPRGVFKLMTPLIARMGRRQEETIWTGLKHYLEAQERSLPPRPEDAAADPA